MSKGWRETKKEKEERQRHTERENGAPLGFFIIGCRPTYIQSGLFFSLKPFWKHPHRHA